MTESPPPEEQGFLSPLFWKNTRGGTCHIDAALESWVGFNLSFKDLPAADVATNEIVTLLSEYVNARRMGASKLACSNIRDRIEVLLFQNHSVAFSDIHIGADAGEWTLLFLSDLFGVDMTVHVRHYDPLCVENCESCQARSVSLSTDVTLDYLDLMLSDKMHLDDFMMNICSNEGLLRRRGCHLVDFDKEPCECTFTYRQEIVSPVPSAIILKMTPPAKHRRHPVEINAQSFILRGTTYNLAAILIRKPGHWWVNVRYNDKWMCVDPFRDHVVEINPLPLRLPDTHTVIMLATTMSPRPCDLPFERHINPLVIPPAPTPAATLASLDKANVVNSTLEIVSAESDVAAATEEAEVTESSVESSEQAKTTVSEEAVVQSEEAVDEEEPAPKSEEAVEHVDEEEPAPKSEETVVDATRRWQHDLVGNRDIVTLKTGVSEYAHWGAYSIDQKYDLTFKNGDRLFCSDDGSSVGIYSGVYLGANGSKKKISFIVGVRDEHGTWMYVTKDKRGITRRPSGRRVWFTNVVPNDWREPNSKPSKQEDEEAKHRFFLFKKAGSWQKVSVSISDLPTKRLTRSSTRRQRNTEDDMDCPGTSPVETTTAQKERPKRYLRDTNNDMECPGRSPVETTTAKKNDVGQRKRIANVKHQKLPPTPRIKEFVWRPGRYKL